MKDSKDIYIKLERTYEKLLKKQTETINFISVIRLIAFISFAGFFAYFLLYKMYYICLSVMVVFIVLFTVLIKQHSKMKHNKNICFSLMEINKDGLKRLNGEWKSFKENGEEFFDKKHNYTCDIDIFGASSLFQYLNSANTHLGKEKLKEALTSPDFNINTILKRQEAIIELSKNLGFRQRLLAEGKIEECKMKDPIRLINWCQGKINVIYNKYFILLIRTFPFITISLIIYYFATYKIPSFMPIVMLLIQWLLLKINSKEIVENLESVDSYKTDIEAYFRMFRLIEKKSFNSKLLKELKVSLVSEDNNKATWHINKLIKLSNKISDRNNFFYMIINLTILWDYQYLIQLEKWKRNSGRFMEKWLLILAEFEALSSLSVARYDNPNWVTPKFENNSLNLKAKNMGHPLLSAQCVVNDINIGEKKTLLITGSNMSGKSTFLRTAGINLVLAYAGAPVRADYFSCSTMKIYTCMRIGDDLEQSISSFYAEILRIKNVINAVKKKEPAFFLLDEIFKGTNSKDRHLGAKILIDSLTKENAIGLVSTHDLELADMEQSNSKVKNYNFREYYENNEIFFDYKLREGVSTTTNALYLMKLAGIEIEE